MGEAPYAPPIPPEEKSKTGQTLGIIGTVLGGLGICAGLGCAWLGYAFAIAAVVLGIIGLSKGKGDENPQTAKTLGIVAIVLGALTLLVSCGNHILGFYLLQSGQMEGLLRQWR